MEADFDVRSAVAPQKPNQVDEKLILVESFFGRKRFRPKYVLAENVFGQFVFRQARSRRGGGPGARILRIFLFYEAQAK